MQLFSHNKCVCETKASNIETLQTWGLEEQKQEQQFFLHPYL